MNRITLAAFATLALTIAAPVAAQQMTSDGFAFLEAVKKGDGEKVNALLAQPSAAILNARDRASGDGALHHVARERNRTWLGFLLSKGARADIQNNDGMTPLAIAAQIGWAEGVEILLARKASVDLANVRGETPLILAVLQRDVPTVRLLLAAGANPRKTDNSSGYSALDYAKRDTRTAAITKMLEIPVEKKKETFGPTF